MRRGPRVPPARRARSRNDLQPDRERSSTRKARGFSVGATCRATTAWSATARGRRSRSSSRCSSAPRDAVKTAEDRQRFERKLYVIRKRIETAVDAVGINALSRRFFYIVSLPRRSTLTYKGMLTARQLAPMFPDLSDSSLESVSGARPSAVQHQHVPVVAARAPVSLHRAQRRDQHAARQHQLDARAPGAAAERSARRRPEEDPAASSARAAATRRSSTTCSSS